MSAVKEKRRPEARTIKIPAGICERLTFACNTVALTSQALTADQKRLAEILLFVARDIGAIQCDLANIAKAARS